VKKIFLFIFALVFLINPTLSLGAELEVECTTAGCTKNTTNPLFSTASDGWWYPGRQITKSILITNKATFPLIIKMTAPRSGMASVLEEVFSAKLTGGATIFEGGLKSFFETSSFDLGIIGAGGNASYALSFDFNANAGNEYQNKASVFEINLNFTEEVAQVTPSATPTPTSDSGDGGTVNGASTSINGPASPPVCNEAVPGAPTGLEATTNADGTITLFWAHPATSHSHYLVAFGTTPGVYPYGDPNVGNDNQYTVRSLTVGAQYCFYVRTINGCMPGGRSEEVCVNSGSAVPATAPIPENFEEGVLGVQTDQTATPTPMMTGETEGNLLGESTSNCGCFWIFGLVALIINLILGLKSGQQSKNKRVMIMLMVSVVAFVLDRYLAPRWCQKWLSQMPVLKDIFFRYCNLIWLWSSLSFLIPLVATHRK